MTDHRGEWFTAMQRVLPQHLLSRLGARLTELESPWLKNRLIKGFSKLYAINLEEAESSNPDDYPTFNHFFTRALKPDARPLETDVNMIVSPADGTVSQIGDITEGEIFQAKGKSFSAQTLLGANDSDTQRLINGKFATIYLSPQDYHRVHMPVDGTLLYCRYIPGKLYSVNQTTAKHIDGLFAKNERLVCMFDTPAGRCAVVLVGAMMVAGIESVWHGHYQAEQYLEINHTENENGVSLLKGEEMGRFKFGSTVILLFENTMQWLPEYQHNTTTRMGEKLAQLK